MKKIIIFMPDISFGGVEKNFFNISNFLKKKKLDISILTLSKFPRNKLNKDIRIIRPEKKFFHSLGRKLKFFICLVFLIREIIFNKQTTVFCFQGIIYCTLICKIFSRRIIVRSNTSPTGWSKNCLKVFFYKKIYKLADLIIVNSIEFKKELKKNLNLDAKCIYNPLDSKIIIKKSKKKISTRFFDNKFLNVINIARLDEQKDHITLLKSIKIVKKKINIKLLIVGSGSEEKNLKEFIKNCNLGNTVKIIPYKSNPFPIIKKADLFILSSKYEGLPNTLLEVALLKKPIISSNCPTGPKEILSYGKGGILFKTGDYLDLSNKIILFSKKKKKYKKKINFAYDNLNKFDYQNRMLDYYNLIYSFINKK